MGLLILSMILFKDFGGGSKESGSRHDRKRKMKLREYIAEEIQADAELENETEADADPQDAER